MSASNDLTGSPPEPASERAVIPPPAPGDAHLLHRDVWLPDERSRLRKSRRSSARAAATSRWRASDAAKLVLYNTCSIREKAAQKVFSRLGTFSQASRSQQDHRRSGLRRAAGRRGDFRARALGEPGMRLGKLQQAAGADRPSSKPGTAASRASTRIPTKHSRPR